MKIDQSIDFFDIDIRVVCSKSDDVLKSMCAGALKISVEYVVLATAKHACGPLFAKACDRVVARFYGRSDDGGCPALKALKPVKDAAKQRRAMNRA